MWTSLELLEAEDEIAESSLVRLRKDGLRGGTGGGEELELLSTFLLLLSFFREIGVLLLLLLL